MMGNRDNKGRFIKGNTGNPNGRPKKANHYQRKMAKPGIVSSSRENNGRFSKGTPGYSGKGDKIYIAWCECDYYKIGICCDARSRMAMMQSNTPYNVELVYLRKVDNAAEIENSIKGMFANKNVRGEWYSFDKLDIDYIQRYIEDVSSSPVVVSQLQLVLAE